MFVQPFLSGEWMQGTSRPAGPASWGQENAKKIAIFKALDVEIKQRGPAAVRKHAGPSLPEEELSQPGITVIAECGWKSTARASPRSYRAATRQSLVDNGARSRSLQTASYFGEQASSEVRSQVKNPLLRRDFIWRNARWREQIMAPMPSALWPPSSPSSGCRLF